jgi:hypothetical protein
LIRQLGVIADWAYLQVTDVAGQAHVRDFHVPLSRLLDLDGNKFTFYHVGTFNQLSRFGGQVSKRLLA